MTFVAPSKLRDILLSVTTLLIGAVGSSTAMVPHPSTATPRRGAVVSSVLQDLNTGHANEAIAMLQADLAKNPASAVDHNLLCRVYIEEERWAPAEQEGMRAVELEPGNSEYHQWLGRAYGDAAAHAPLTTAYSLAKKVRAEFETAVRLDPANESALSDLGEYLIDVPRILGGGAAQAEKIAQQLQPLNAARYHALQSKIDARKSDDAGAEQELKLAIQTSSYPADEWMNLAMLYADRKKYAAMKSAIENGMAADPSHGPALVAGATLLIEKHKDAALAEHMLREYLASHQQSEDAPAFRVEVQLGRLLAEDGHTAEAAKEFAEAQALASQYEPAQQAQQG